MIIFTHPRVIFNKMSRALISRTVWTLSLVSLFTDVASEMLYPVMPAFLKSIGFSVVLIGLLEGLAEAAAGLSKGYFGKLSDTRGERVPFVRAGYLMSSLAKPLMAVSFLPAWIFVCRTVDRLGKGIRTGARDAMLSAEATPQTKARVFGLHRAMDTTGAFLGPLLAMLFLFYYPGEYKLLFVLSFGPGVLAILLTFFLREGKKPEPVRALPSLLSFIRYWKEAPAAYRRLTAGLLFFALVNSSDVFLLLKIREAGHTDIEVIGLYIFYNMVYAAAAYPAGRLADRWGLKITFVSGLILFSIVYAAMGAGSGLFYFGLLFLGYGLYAACTESVAKAWITNIVAPGEAATAVGTYTAFQSVCTLMASAGAGWIWYTLGDHTLFIMTGALSFLASLYFARLKY